MPAAACPPRRLPTDLTDAQWRLLAPLLPAPRSGPGRPGRPATSRRALSNAILLEVLPRRWVVEQTFSWLGKYRTLAVDHERKLEHHQPWVQWAMSA